MTTAARALKRQGQLLLGRATCRLRALPDFLIVGAQKGGTTSLYRYLVQHPQVLPVVKKEVHFFDLSYRRGTCWYRAYFPLEARRRLGGGRIVGEASPYYLFHPAVPERVARTVPTAKIVALLRDPVERAYSHYRHSVDHGHEALPSFEAAIAAEPQRLAEAAPGGAAHQHHSYLARGRYAEQLERWFAHLPREQVLVLRSEDLFADTATVFARVIAFLGLAPWSPPAFPAYNANRPSPVAAKIRRELEDHFAAPNRRLAELLGDEVWWPVTAADRARESESPPAS